MFKKNELGLLWPFYLVYFLFGFSAMIMPFFAIYFLDLGFNFFQISFILSAFALGKFIFEIPTGAFADNFGRKFSVVSGFFITGIVVLLIPQTSSFSLILLLWVLAGFGMTFVSGAEEAWVIDNLTRNGMKDLKLAFFRKVQIFALLGAFLSPVLGSIIVKYYSITPLWYLFSAGFLFSGLVLLIFPKEYFKPKKTNLSNLISNLILDSKKSIKFSITHKNVFLLLIAGIFVSLMGIGDTGWQPLLVSFTMPVHQLGYLMSIASIFSIIIIVFSGFLTKFKPKYSVSFLLLFEIILLLSLLFISPPHFLVLAFIMIIIQSMSVARDPILQSYLHDFIPEEIRATVVSTQSMFLTLFISLSSILGGFLLDIYGPQQVIAFSSLFGLIGIFFYLKIKD